MRTLKQKLCLVCGVTVLTATVLPPLNRIAAQLFAAHMLQHLLAIAVAAPLLAAGGILRGLARGRIAEWFMRPATAWVAFVSIFLFWHLPAAFQWAAQSEAATFLELGTILAGALLFWNAVFLPEGRERFSYGARALCVMTAAVATDLPGVIFVFAPHAIGSMPGENAFVWGLTPLEDQQIAGLLMWVPANLVFFSIATFLFAVWISDGPPTHRPVTS